MTFTKNSKFKDYFTTSVSEDKTFKKVKNFQTYFKDEESGRWIPKFRNTHEFAVNNNWGQIGNGTNHKVRGSFIVDCDYPYTADYLLNLFSRYFVKPTTILRNKITNHCQVHFFFTKDIPVYRGYIPLKRHAKFMEYSRKLNEWMNLGDVKWTGYWMKNPFSDKWVKEYDSMKEYSFENLCLLIDELPNNKEIGNEFKYKEAYERLEKFRFQPESKEFEEAVRDCEKYSNFKVEERNWNDVETIDTSILASLALGEEIDDPFVDEYGVKHSYKKFDKLYREPTDKEKAKYSNNEEVTQNEETSDLEKKEERRGKYKKGSENRHSVLFNIMKVNISSYNYDNEYVMKLALVYNTFFDNPLSEKELNAEVFNETTLKRTFGTLRSWRESGRERKENEVEMMSEITRGDFYELGMRVNSLYSQLRLAKEYWPEIDCSELEKKYKELYLGKYKGKYEETKEYDKIRTKVKDWMKRHDKNDKYPKKWREIELKILKELQ